MKRKNQNHQSGNEDLKRQNNHLDQQSKLNSIVPTLSRWITNKYSNSKYLFQFCLTVRQLERQMNAAGESDMMGIRNDQNSSESEMSDIDDDESQVDIVSTPAQSNAKKIKTTYNAKVMYQ